MASITQPLRDEHKELFPQVELLRKAGEAVKEGALNEELRRLTDGAYDFLAHHLIPHAQAEERALYPVVQRVMGAPRATATMSRDHQEVDELTAQFSAAARVVAGRAQRRTGQRPAPCAVRFVQPGESPLCQGRGDLPAPAG